MLVTVKIGQSSTILSTYNPCHHVKIRISFRHINPSLLRPTFIYLSELLFLCASVFLIC